MQYHKFIVGDTIIEFHNNWLGEETVIVNGKMVSKESSFMGMHHHFSILEDGSLARYVLTTKVTEMMQVALDLRRNGNVIHENIIVSIGSKPKMPKNNAKLEGISKLNEYDLEAASKLLLKSLDVEPDNPEIFFHMACSYSVQENAIKGFESIQKAVEFKLADTEMILNHEMLAFLRIHPAFESFLDSGFKEIDRSLFKKEEKNK